MGHVFGNFYEHILKTLCEQIVTNDFFKHNLYLFIRGHRQLLCLRCRRRLRLPAPALPPPPHLRNQIDSRTDLHNNNELLEYTYSAKYKDIKKVFQQVINECWKTKGNG